MDIGKRDIPIMHAPVMDRPQVNSVPGFLPTQEATGNPASAEWCSVLTVPVQSVLWALLMGRGGQSYFKNNGGEVLSDEFL